MGIKINRLFAGLMLIGLIGLAGCSADQTANNASDNASDKASAGSTGEASPLKLYVFQCGEIDFPSIAAFGVDDVETPVRRLVVPCYVIDHPEGRLLWDGGLPFSMAEPAGWQTDPDSGIRARLQQTVKDQLLGLDLGFDLSSIDYAAFSHIHYDHVGAANDLTNATWLVQRGDYDALMARDGSVPAVDPSLFSEIKNRPTQVLDGDFDVFGDGRKQLVSAPGHTPGHQVLYLELADFGPLVLSGDLYHFRLSRAQRRVPVFNVDSAQTLTSMDKVEALVANSGATFWIEHDAQLFETLTLAPGFYQ